jgi:hypothetical protein
MKQNGEEFSVEATPVVEVKRPSANAGQAFENEKTEVYLEDEGGGGSAYLVDASGDHHPITAFPFVMGRGNECDLVLTGKGISRKHAEIVFQSGRFVVNDLDSLNGLKVNGYKVARVILEENDAIKLGEATLTFTTAKQSSSSSSSAKSGGSKASAKKSSAAVEPELGGLDDLDTSGMVTGAGNPFANEGTDSRKWLRVGLVAGAVILAGASGYFYLNAPTAEPVGAIVTPPQPSVSTANVDAAPQGDASNAPGASGVADPAANSADPLAGTPLAYDGSAAASAMSPAPAEASFSPSPDVMSGVEPPPSIAMTPPVAQAPAVAPAAKPPQAPAASKPVVKPPAAPRVATAPKPVSAPKPAAQPAPIAAVAPSGSSNAVSRADAAYLAGNADSIIAELQKQSAGNSAASRAAATKRDQLLKAYNLYLTGKQASLEGDNQKALEFYERYLDAEKSLFGAKRSVYGKQAASKLMDTWVAVGNEAAQSKRSHEAYQAWQKALGYGDSVAARIAVDSANQKSRTLYRQALRLEYVNTDRAKDLWRQVMELVPPGSEYHNKAREKLTWYEKWGS